MGMRVYTCTRTHTHTHTDTHTQTDTLIGSFSESRENEVKELPRCSQDKLKEDSRIVSAPRHFLAVLTADTAS